MKHIAIIILFILLLSACQNKAEVKVTPEAPKVNVSHVVEEVPEPKVYEPDNIESELEKVIGSRTKSTDREEISYSKEEIDSGVFMEQRIEYQKTDDGFNGTINLEFSGQTDTRHIVVIPKEFAQSVDDLNFSIEPSRIINPDPEVEFNLKLEGFSVVGIEITTKGKGTAVELFDAFDKQKSFSLCDKVPEGMRDFCYAAAIGKLKKPKVADCDKIKGDEGKDSCYGVVAAATDDINICAKHIKSQEAQTDCFTAFAAVKGKEICNKIQDAAAKKVCLLVFEAKETGKTTEDLVKEKSKEPAKPSDDIIFDLRILAGDDDEYFINTSYGFEASLDPPSALPKNPEYEFQFSDGGTLKGSSNTINREFTKSGTYTLTTKIIDKNTGSVAATKSRSFTFKEKEEEKEEKKIQNSGMSVSDCTDKGTECGDSCNKICGEKKNEYCRKYEYSGCAMDVFCWCNSCVIYDTKWCPKYAGYIGCAEGVKGKYKSCIENCQSKREAEEDISTCWTDCNKDFNSSLSECKQTPCQDFCDSKGYDKGEWANYTPEYGWDSCYCSD